MKEISRVPADSAPSMSTGSAGDPDKPRREPRVGDADGAPAAFLAAYGDDAERALGELMSSVQAELRRIARRARMKLGDSPSLGTTDLVNEAYLRLVCGAPQITDERHFFALAARTMRWILVSRERKHRHCGELPSGIWEPLASRHEIDLLDLDGALSRLREHDEELARLVELKFFLNLSIEEISASTGLSPATVGRRWAVARRWLHRELEAGR